jgi:hypothetical protein
MGLLDTANYTPAAKNDAYARAIAAWYKYREARPDLADQARLQLISGTIGQAVPVLAATDFTAPPPVRAVGVFDTVSSLGAPHVDFQGNAKFDFSICDTNLNVAVINGFHALAADEMRDVFSPTFWTPAPNVTQRVFPGCHSDVGGGFSNRGLSDGTLDWMLTQLAGAGMPVNRSVFSPALAPLSTAPAEDDGARWPASLQPRHHRRFPVSAAADAAIAQRRGHWPPGVECIPDTALRQYAPAGLYEDGTPL